MAAVAATASICVAWKPVWVEGHRVCKHCRCKEKEHSEAIIQRYKSAASANKVRKALDRSKQRAEEDQQARREEQAKKDDVRRTKRYSPIEARVGTAHAGKLGFGYVFYRGPTPPETLCLECAGRLFLEYENSDEGLLPDSLVMGPWGYRSTAAAEAACGRCKRMGPQQGPIVPYWTCCLCPDAASASCSLPNLEPMHVD